MDRKTEATIKAAARMAAAQFREEFGPGATPEAQEVTRGEDADAWRLAAEACDALGIPEFSRVWVARSGAHGSNPLETIYAV